MDFQQALLSLNRSQHFPKTSTLLRMEKAISLLNNPQDGLRFIHIAGTNGKGSTGALIKAGLEKAGFSVGRFISPHLLDITERIAIGKEHISKDDFAKHFTTLTEVTNKEGLELSYFEQMTLLALLYFQNKRPDFIIWETGLGGRLDATNIVNPLISVITPIGLDHTQLLGGDLLSIANEKAQIIKEGKTVIASQTGEVEEVFIRQAHSVKSEVVLAKHYLPVNLEFFGLNGSIVEIPKLNAKFNLPLLGRHQGENALTALLVLRELNEYITELNLLDRKIDITDYHIFDDAIWPGRLQYFRELNLLVDGAHNTQAMETFTCFVKEIDIEAKLIFASMGDKDYFSMVKQLDGLFKEVYLPRLHNKRSIEPEKIKSLFHQTPSIVFESLEEALDYAVLDKSDSSSSTKSFVALVGSLYMVGEGYEILDKRIGIKDIFY